MVTAGERRANFLALPVASPPDEADSRPGHRVSDGLQLLRNSRALVFYIACARTRMPKSTSE